MAKGKEEKGAVSAAGPTLIVVNSFEAWGRLFTQGEEIPLSDPAFAVMEKKGPGSLTRRIQGGDLKYKMPDEIVAAGAAAAGG